MPTRGNLELVIEHLTDDASHPLQIQTPTSRQQNSNINISALGSMPKRGNHELVIEHLTYDASHPPIKSPTPRNQQNSNEQDSSRTPPTPTETEDIVTYIMTQSRLEKASRKTEKMATKANSRGRYLHLPSTPLYQNFPTTTTKAKKSSPQLRRKEKFSDFMMARLNRLSDENENENDDENKVLIENDENMQRFAEVREKIREGKLERVIPPWSKEKEDSLAPPRRQRRTSSHSAPGERFIDSPRPVKYASQSAPSERTIKSPTPLKSTEHRSPAQKLAAYVEKGKGVAMQSEDDQNTQNEAIQGLQTSQNEERSRRRISGEGTSPWYNPVPVEKCRLCNKPDTQGIRGLCSDCEQDFVRPKTTFGLSLSLSNSEDEEEIKPTPPLKNLKTLQVSLRKSLPPNPNPFLDTFQEEESETEKIILPLFNKDNVRLGMTPKSKPIFRTVDLSVIETAQRAEIEEVEESDSDEETILRWEKGPFSPTISPKENLKRGVFEDWGACYSSGEYARFDKEEETAPLIPTKEEEKKENRDTVFYGYWDELLG